MNDEARIMRRFFEICLTSLMFLSIFATTTYNDRDGSLSSKKREAFRAALCIAHCQEEDKNCRDDCREPSTNRENIDDDGLIFNYKNGTKFYGSANFNATLHCKDIDVIKIKHNPGIWVIEQSSRIDSSRVDGEKEEEDDGEKRIQLSDRTTITSFTNLSAGTFYRYKAHGVTSDGFITEPEISPWFETFKMGHRSEEVKNLELSSQQLDELNPSRVRADIIFQPASDRSCHYEVISFNDDQGLTIGNLDSSQDFRFSLHDLDYDTNVSVFVSSRNMGNNQSSNNVSRTFVTPSCLELHRNLTFCAPDQVTGLRASEMHENQTNYNIVVKWDKPSFIPDNYTLRIQSVDYSGNRESSPVFTSIVSGNMTEALLTIQMTNNELDDHQRIISIIAESAGGTSLQTWIHITLDEIIDVSSSPGVTAATMTKTGLQDIGLIAVASVALIAILLVGIAWFCRVRNRDDRNKRNNNKGYKYCQQNLNDGGKKSNNGSSTFHAMEKNLKLEFGKKDPMLAPLIDKFEIRPAQLTIKNILGSGASGIVRLGSFCDHKKVTIDVAIKMLKDNPNTDDLKNFQQEISIMKSAGQHQNIVSIIGCCTLEVTRPMLIVEYCSRGDLQTYLRTIWQETVSRDLERRARKKNAIQDNNTRETVNNEVENITYWIEAPQIAITNQLYDIQEEYMLRETEDQSTVTDLLSFARQVAAGMEFLSSNRVIHRDLAARNVLLCADKTAKICDFGLSRDIYQENVYKKQGNSRLPLKWMAIEALTHQIYTTQSDVWSFGILLWEIVTLGCNPYPETPTNMILQLLKSGYRMEKPDNCGNELYNIMLSCWRSRPRRRPNFTELKQQLDRLLRTASDNEYLNMYDLLRDSTATCPSQHESMKLIANNDYSNIYSK